MSDASLVKIAKFFLLFFLEVISLVGLVSCSSETVHSANQTQQVTLHAVTGDVLVNAEVADDETELSQGLMFRETLAENAGMLFVFDEESRKSFWMKDTPLTLDMLFISSAKEIVYIAENTVPYSTDAIFPEPEALYVLEVNGGFCNRHNVSVGDFVSF